jgi:hypothetical protein
MRDDCEASQLSRLNVVGRQFDLDEPVLPVRVDQPQVWRNWAFASLTLQLPGALLKRLQVSRLTFNDTPLEFIAKLQTVQPSLRPFKPAPLDRVDGDLALVDLQAITSLLDKTAFSECSGRHSECSRRVF